LRSATAPAERAYGNHLRLPRRTVAAKTRPRTSPPKPILIVPHQVLPPRPMLGALRNPQLRVFEAVVVLPVAEVGVDVVAHSNW